MKLTAADVARLGRRQAQPERAPGEQAGKASRFMPPANLGGACVTKDVDVVLRLIIPGDPCSKQRPRWSPKSRTVYTPERTRSREQAIAALAKTAHRELMPDGLSLFSLRLGFYLGTNQARDVDNMTKLVADALTGVVWDDDRQVAEVFAFKVPADRPDEARTEVVVAKLPGAMNYTMATCLLCRRAYRTYPSWRFRLWCSRRCFSLAHRERVTLTCAGCGTEFEVQKSLEKQRRFCTRDCRTASQSRELTCSFCGVVFRAPHHRRRKRPVCSKRCAIAFASLHKAKKPQTVCGVCGAPVSRREYRRCNRCKIAGIRPPDQVAPLVEVRVAPSGADGRPAEPR